MRSIRTWSSKPAISMQHLLLDGDGPKRRSALLEPEESGERGSSRTASSANNARNGVRASRNSIAERALGARRRPRRASRRSLHAPAGPRAAARALDESPCRASARSSRGLARSSGCAPSRSSHNARSGQRAWRFKTPAPPWTCAPTTDGRAVAYRLAPARVERGPSPAISATSTSTSRQSCSTGLGSAS